MRLADARCSGSVRYATRLVVRHRKPRRRSQHRKGLLVGGWVVAGAFKLGQVFAFRLGSAKVVGETQGEQSFAAGPTQSLQVTRRTRAMSFLAMCSWAQGQGWQVMARNQSETVCPRGTARDGRCAPCSPSSSKIHGVGVRLSPGT